MRYIGIDVGFGYTKAMDGTKNILFPSVISPPAEIKFRPWWEDQTDSLNYLLNHLAVTLDGKSYFVGNLALHQGWFAYATLDRIRTKTDEYRLLFLTTLALFAESPEEEFSVITGLPVDDYEDREAIENALCGRFKLSLAGQEHSFFIRNLTVIPQPCGAYMDLLFRDTQGNVNEEYARGLVGVIDIGYKTTDFVLMQSAEFVWKYSGSLKHGMSTIYQAAIPKLTARYPGNFDLRSVEEAISEGVICRLGERMAIDPALLDADFSGLAGEIASWVQRRWSDQKLNRILCTGGGSLPLKPYLARAFPKMLFMDHPQQANVRGFYKGALYYYA